MDEFSLIARYLSPLAGEGSLGLLDDVAILPDGPKIGSRSDSGFEAGSHVLSMDTYIEGVHYPDNWPPHLIGPRTLRAAISDIVAKGCVPTHYLLSVTLPSNANEAYFMDLARGFHQAQIDLKVTLIGGDTVSGLHRSSISLTVMGRVDTPPVLRSGARHADDVWVTGNIGDAFMGLQSLERPDAPKVWRDAYARPAIRAEFSAQLPSFASAGADVSDGLIADAEHIATASSVCVRIDLTCLPISDATEQAGKTQTDLLSYATGGDDYQIIFTASPSKRDAIIVCAQKTQTPVARIGVCAPGTGVKVYWGEPPTRDDMTGRSREIDVPQKGYNHFRR